MGYLTTITIHNDALHSFKKDPKKFAETIFEGINRANEENSSVEMGFNGYCNYITVHPTIHADHHHIYVHYGNSVECIHGHSKEWEKLCELKPEYSESLVEIVGAHLEKMKRVLKKIKEKHNQSIE